jgi:sensor c-di-GMP phosphodiesterase-like protein
MSRKLRQRVLVGHVATILVTACGLAAGYQLGCAFAIQRGTNWLVQYSNLAGAQDDASFAEARSVLTVLKDSPYSFCSDAEIAYFRGLVFRSENLKDAGRIQGGKIDCSATAGHPAQSIGPFKPDLQHEDGTIVYSNLAPITNANLKRAALQLGTAYVVFGSNLPAGPGPIPMQMSATPSDTAHDQASPAAGGAPNGNAPNLRVNGTGQMGDILYATRCSALHFNCVTATTTASQVLHGETDYVTGLVIVGGLLGLLFGMAFSSVYARDRNLGQQLRRAVERDELKLVYQPIVNLSDRQIVGAEVLSRWTDEEGKAIQPDVFIKIAEELGFMGAITKSVLQHALHDFAETFHNHPDFRISINVAAADLVDPNFLPMLKESLRRMRVKPESLVIEITERSAADSEVAIETIRTLRRMGHSIHIDDFGTGYSNLDKLLCLFADTIKIDKAFTKVIGTESPAVAILPQILSMAKSLNLEVVVEGVETVGQADYFSPETQEIYAQGWLYGRPVSAKEFQGLLGDRVSPAPVALDPIAAFTMRPGALHIVDSLVG